MADSQLLRAASRRRPQMSADAELMPCASHTRAAATARPLWCEHRMRERARIRKAKGCCALLDDCGSSEYDEYRVVLGSVWFREVGTRQYSIWWSTGTRVRYSLSEYRAHRAILRAFRLAAEYVEVCCILRLELTRREIAQKRGLWSTERKACSTASTRFDGEYDRVERSTFGSQSGSALARSMALLETAGAMTATRDPVRSHTYKYTREDRELTQWRS